MTSVATFTRIIEENAKLEFRVSSTPIPNSGKWLAQCKIEVRKQGSSSSDFFAFQLAVAGAEDIAQTALRAKMTPDLLALQRILRYRCSPARRAFAKAKSRLPWNTESRRYPGRSSRFLRPGIPNLGLIKPRSVVLP